MINEDLELENYMLPMDDVNDWDGYQSEGVTPSSKRGRRRARSQAS